MGVPEIVFQPVKITSADFVPELVFQPVKMTVAREPKWLKCVELALTFLGGPLVGGP